ncbi:hypothetical protein, partial [Hymenobacter latericus]|uniref:hypothetical protein n=1 Tax=Hymenobacter sp. YIM 151858-1 TaxID=2987688 RepID=UPI0022262324
YWPDTCSVAGEPKRVPHALSGNSVLPTARNRDSPFGSSEFNCFHSKRNDLRCLVSGLYEPMIIARQRA